MLTLSPRSKLIKGRRSDAEGKPVQYQVLGMPPREQVEIARHIHPDRSKWRIFRKVGDEQGEWGGAYETAEEALVVLESEFSRR